jgi:hypothetical protein
MFAIILLSYINIYSDHMNLDQGLPVLLEDAFPLAYRDREVQVYFQYVEKLEQRYRINLTPILEAGFPVNTQLEINVPLIFGNADKTGSADIQPAILYNFNMEGIYLPAVAFEAALSIPTGKYSEGLDPHFKLIFTKTIRAARLNRIHFNGEYTLNTKSKEKERDHLYTFIAGYSQRITPNSIIIFDILRERNREDDSDHNVFEAGTRTQLDPVTVFSIGGGIGIREQSPRFHVTIGLQRSLSGQFLIF